MVIIGRCYIRDCKLRGLALINRCAAADAEVCYRLARRYGKRVLNGFIVRVALTCISLIPLDFGVNTPSDESVASFVSAGASAVAHIISFVSGFVSPHSRFIDEFVLSLDGKTFALKVVGVSLGTALLPSILTEEILPTTPALDTFIVTFLETPPAVAVRVVDLLYSTSPSPPSRPVTVPEASTTAIDLSAISQVRSPV